LEFCFFLTFVCLYDDGVAVGAGDTVGVLVGTGVGEAVGAGVATTTLSGICKSLKKILDSIFFIVSWSKDGVRGKDTSFGTLGSGSSVMALYTPNETQTTLVKRVRIRIEMIFGNLFCFIEIICLGMALDLKLLPL
jgi:hypothetical protein